MSGVAPAKRPKVDKAEEGKGEKVAGFSSSDDFGILDSPTAGGDGGTKWYEVKNPNRFNYKKGQNDILFLWYGDATDALVGEICKVILKTRTQWLNELIAKKITVNPPKLIKAKLRVQRNWEDIGLSYWVNKLIEFGKGLKSENKKSDFVKAVDYFIDDEYTQLSAVREGKEHYYDVANDMSGERRYPTMFNRWKMIQYGLERISELGEVNIPGFLSKFRDDFETKVKEKFSVAMADTRIRSFMLNMQLETTRVPRARYFKLEWFDIYTDSGLDIDLNKNTGAQRDEMETMSLMMRKYLESRNQLGLFGNELAKVLRDIYLYETTKIVILAAIENGAEYQNLYDDGEDEDDDDKRRKKELKDFICFELFTFDRLQLFLQNVSGDPDLISMIGGKSDIPQMVIDESKRRAPLITFGYDSTSQYIKSLKDYNKLGERLRKAQPAAVVTLHSVAAATSSPPLPLPGPPPLIEEKTPIDTDTKRSAPPLPPPPPPPPVVDLSALVTIQEASWAEAKTYCSHHDNASSMWNSVVDVYDQIATTDSDIAKMKSVYDKLYIGFKNNTRQRTKTQVANELRGVIVAWIHWQLYAAMANDDATKKEIISLGNVDWDKDEFNKAAKKKVIEKKVKVVKAKKKPEKIIEQNPDDVAFFDAMTNAGYPIPSWWKTLGTDTKSVRLGRTKASSFNVNFGAYMKKQQAMHRKYVKVLSEFKHTVEEINQDGTVAQSEYNKLGNLMMFHEWVIDDTTKIREQVRRGYEENEPKTEDDEEAELEVIGKQNKAMTIAYSMYQFTARSLLRKLKITTREDDEFTHVRKDAGVSFVTIYNKSSERENVQYVMKTLGKTDGDDDDVVGSDFLIEAKDDDEEVDAPVDLDASDERLRFYKLDPFTLFPVQFRRKLDNIARNPYKHPVNAKQLTPDLFELFLKPNMLNELTFNVRYPIRPNFTVELKLARRNSHIAEWKKNVTKGKEPRTSIANFINSLTDAERLAIIPTPDKKDYTASEKKAARVERKETKTKYKTMKKEFAETVYNAWKAQKILLAGRTAIAIQLNDGNCITGIPGSLIFNVIMKCLQTDPALAAYPIDTRPLGRDLNEVDTKLIREYDNYRSEPTGGIRGVRGVTDSFIKGITRCMWLSTYGVHTKTRAFALGSEAATQWRLYTQLVGPRYWSKWTISEVTFDWRVAIVPMVYHRSLLDSILLARGIPKNGLEQANAGGVTIIDKIIKDSDDSAFLFMKKVNNVFASPILKKYALNKDKKLSDEVKLHVDGINDLLSNPSGFDDKYDATTVKRKLTTDYGSGAKKLNPAILLVVAQVMQRFLLRIRDTLAANESEELKDENEKASSGVVINRNIGVAEGFNDDVNLPLQEGLVMNICEIFNLLSNDNKTMWGKSEKLKYAHFMFSGKPFEFVITQLPETAEQEEKAILTALTLGIAYVNPIILNDDILNLVNIDVLDAAIDSKEISDERAKERSYKDAEIEEDDDGDESKLASLTDEAAEAMNAAAAIEFEKNESKRNEGRKKFLGIVTGYVKAQESDTSNAKDLDDVEDGEGDGEGDDKFEGDEEEEESDDDDGEGDDSDSGGESKSPNVVVVKSKYNFRRPRSETVTPNEVAADVETATPIEAAATTTPPRRLRRLASRSPPPVAGRPKFTSVSDDNDSDDDDDVEVAIDINSDDDDKEEKVVHAEIANDGHDGVHDEAEVDEAAGNDDATEERLAANEEMEAAQASKEAFARVAARKRGEKYVAPAPRAVIVVDKDDKSEDKFMKAALEGL